MIKDFLYNLFINCKVLDLTLITIIYIINYLVLLKFGSVISQSKVNLKDWLISSVFMGLFGIFTKPFVIEWMFGLINSILIISILIFYFKPIDLKSLWKSVRNSALSWIVINLLIAICLGLLLKPLLLIIPKEFYCSTLGILIGTFLEFGPLLILLLLFDKKWNQKWSDGFKNEKM